MNMRRFTSTPARMLSLVHSREAVIQMSTHSHRAHSPIFGKSTRTAASALTSVLVRNKPRESFSDYVNRLDKVLSDPSVVEKASALTPSYKLPRR